MDIIIETPGFKANNGLETFVREKISKLEHHSQEIVRANVTLFSGPPSDPQHCHCEIRLEVPGTDHFVKKNSDTYEKAIVDTVSTLTKLLQQAKDKFITRRQSGRDKG